MLTFQEKTHRISGAALEETPNRDRGKIGLVQTQPKEWQGLLAKPSAGPL